MRRPALTAERPAPKPRAERPSRAPRRWLPKRDYGGLAARAICAVFAAVGVLPLALGVLVRLAPVERWAARETARLVAQTVRVEAHYALEVVPWPLEIRLEQLRVEANDGLGPALTARSVVVRPRLFALLDGVLDVGEVEIDEPHLRAVIAGGRLTNVDYELPESDRAGTNRAPFAELAVNSATVDVTIDRQAAVHARDVDVDVAVRNTTTVDAPRLGVSVRTGEITIDRRHADPSTPGYESTDEDRICSLELRAVVGQDEVFVRRLALQGSADLDPERGTRPACELAAGDWRHVALELESTRVALGNGGSVDGRASLTAPVGLAHRFAEVPPATGSLTLALDSFSFAAGERLPRLRGRVHGEGLGVEGKHVARTLDGALALDGDRLVATSLALEWGGGKATLAEVRVRPLEASVPIDARDIRFSNIRLEEMLDELGGHPSAWVSWTLEDTRLERFGGTVIPLQLAGKIGSSTRDFGVFDRPSTDPLRETRLGVKRAEISGNFRITPEGVLLEDFAIATPASRLVTTVSLGFAQDLGIAIAPESFVELGELSPIAGTTMTGLAHLGLAGSGKFTNPHITGTVGVESFVLQGFPIGTVAEAKVDFRPLVLALADARLDHGASSVTLPRLTVDFGRADAALVIDGELDSRASGLRFRDFLDMLNLSADPRFSGLAARLLGLFDVDFTLKRSAPPCLVGRLAVTGKAALAETVAYGERFDSGTLDFDYVWDDLARGSHGVAATVHAATLTKGSGTALLRATIGHGGVLEGDVVAGGIPIASLDMLGLGAAGTTPLLAPEGTVSATGRIGGTLERMTGSFDVDVSTVRIGPDALAPSRFLVRMEPVGDAPKMMTSCGRSVPVDKPPDGATASTRPSAEFRVSGMAFGNGLTFDALTITREANAKVTGKVHVAKLDLAPLANLVPGIAYSDDAVRGSVTGIVDFKSLRLAEPVAAHVTLTLASLHASQRGRSVKVTQATEPLELVGGSLHVPSLPAELTLPGGVAAKLELSGRVDSLAGKPELDLFIELPPLELGALAGKLPFVQRASGTLESKLSLRGPLAAPVLSGKATLSRGSLRFSGVPVPLDDIDVEVRVHDNELNMVRATATSGGSGRLSLTGSVPLGANAGSRGSASLVVRELGLPLAEGVKATASAELSVSRDPAAHDDGRTLPHVGGTVTLTSFTYSRPMAFRLDLGALTRAAATTVKTYDPDADHLTFDVNVVAPRSLRIENDLVDARLEIDPPGLRVSGTDQRFGASGALRIDPSSKLFLQGHDFRVRSGSVRFDDLSRVQPRIDIVADTEYRRQAASQSAEQVAATDGSRSGSSDAGSWRITMHATGDTEAPALSLTSEPPLAQEDIVLLLQVGMTRAELDRGLATSLAQSVSLEALSAVTGLGQAVKRTVPLIDEFRLGSQYSSVSGRPEPTVTVGKRISDDVRATVTSGLSDGREVRTNVDWKLGRRLSVQGSYDNINDAASSTVGNLGVDLRWRLEFE